MKNAFLDKVAKVNAKLGKHFQICLQSGPRGLTILPNSQPDHKKAVFFPTASLRDTVKTT